MRIFLRIILSLLFIPIFLIFLLLTSLKFQILNYDYLVSSFEKNNIYKNVDSFQQSVLLEQEKKGNKGELDIKITPQLAKELIEKNLKSILGFINGKNSKMLMFIPGQGEIELTKLAPNFPKDQLEKARNIGSYSLIAWIVSLVLILGIIFLHSRLGWKRDKFSEIYFILIGTFFIIFGALARFFLIQMGRDLVKPGGSEPSQVLIGMMANSILPKVANLWILIALTLVLLASALLIFKKIKKI